MTVTESVDSRTRASAGIQGRCRAVSRTADWAPSRGAYGPDQAVRDLTPDEGADLVAEFLFIGFHDGER
ncbi:hypothetical protein [Micromonospora inositola]|uniref:hypothetical protein n=1 Tax=Micromonospora inositola TaxID=47865 RepID=UPI0012FDEBB2|nr:hypothetical protein [Micromonospora inositola]